MLNSTGPKSLLGQYSGIFLKPLRPLHRKNLEKSVQGTLLLQDFDPMKVDLLGSYDKDLTPNRTWWFRFNQLPTLGWGAGIWGSTNHGHEYVDFNFEVICNWANHSAEQLPLKWHDHASAFRMKNMADWYVTVANHSTKHDKDLEVLAELIDEHLQWLCDDANYSRRTNHGFEQARFMMSVAAEMPGLPTSKQALELALLRLQDEIRFAFTGQGVHKENSPGYQWFMIKVMQEAKAMLDGYELSLPDIDFRKMLNRAKRFLDAIALPDNSLPLIGDTQYKEKQNAYVAKLRRNKPKGEGVQVFDYSKSGYVIVKNFTDQESPIHLVFKNGHLSDYHRHNDDLSIHLTKGDQVIFGDGGLYSHNQNDVGRQYTKSAWAHNTTFPLALAEKKVKIKKLARSPSLLLEKELSAKGKTWNHYPEAEVERQISWSNSHDYFDLQIKDRAVSLGNSLVTNFIIPTDIDKVILDQNCGVVSIVFYGFTARLLFEKQKVDVKVVDGSSYHDAQSSPHELSMISPSMRKEQSAVRLEFHWKKSVSDNTFRVELRDYI